MFSIFGQNTSTAASNAQEALAFETGKKI